MLKSLLTERKLLLSLVGLNVVLALLLVGKFRQSTAFAQLGRPADYLMITGEINGNTNAVIYLVDLSNGLVGGMIFDPTRSRFDLLPPVDLARVLETAQPGNGNNRPNR